jgi:hypothetical protein
MAPESTELGCVAPLGWLLDCEFVVDGDAEDVMVATSFCSNEDKVGSANPAAGTVDVAPPVALKEDYCQLSFSLHQQRT